MGLSALLLWVGLCLGLGEPAELPAGGPAEVVVEGQPLVALTFDDGPRQDTTGQLLEGLALRETPATFFLVGERIAGQEELVRAMAEGGHQIGIHTYDHVRIAGLSRSDFEEQMERPQTLLNEILGQGDYWFRPPYGIVDSAVIQWADGPLILWSVDPEDWKDRDADRIVNAVLERVQDGDIILMHDIYDSSVDAALRIVDALLEQGYCFVTVEQLMAQRQVEPERGVLYTSLP
jgi:peptidoglycan/xylan/chitin deacetylase (PgdA/CDA1 family)